MCWHRQKTQYLESNPFHSGIKNVASIVKLCLAAKQDTKEEEEGSREKEGTRAITNNRVPAIQQMMPTFHFS